MKYVTKTAHSSDCPENRDSRKQKLPYQNEGNSSTHGAFMCSGDIFAPKNLSTGKFTLSRARNLLCEICKVAATPNYQFFPKYKEVLNPLICAITSRNHRINHLPKKITHTKNSFGRSRISGQCNYDLNFSNPTTNNIRPAKSYSSMTTAKTVANGNQYSTSPMFHYAFHQALLISSIKEYIRPTRTPAPLNSG